MDELQQAHSNLMQAYREILNRVSKIPFRHKMNRVVDDPQSRRVETKAPYTYAHPFEFGGATVLRGLVHVFVEQHLARQLKELSTCYLLEYLSLPAESSSGRDASWMREAAEDCRSLAESFASWNRLRRAVKPIRALIGSLLVAFGISTAIEVVSNVEATILQSVLFASLYLLVYFFFFVADSFAYKRELFLPGAQFIERHSELPDISRNVYALENGVFDFLGKRKKSEFPWDHAARTIGPVGLTLVLSTFAILSAENAVLTVLLLAGGSLTTARLLVDATRQFRRRVEWHLR